MTDDTYVLKVIGYVRNSDSGARIELLPEYAPALAGLEEFSHAMVVWWCHLLDSDEYRSIVSAGKPYVNGPDGLGIFATRSPVRPNPIAFSPAMITGHDVENGVIETPFLDAEDGSPVLDIKPYSPSIDRVRNATTPAWCSHWPATYEENEVFDWDAEFAFQR